MADANTRASAKQGEEAAADDDAGNKKKRAPRRSKPTSKSSSKPASRKPSTTSRTAAKQTTDKKPSKRASTSTSATRANTRSADTRGPARRTRAAPATVQPSTAPRKVTMAMGGPTRGISLRSDLQKHNREDYVAEDFTTGAQLIIDAGAGAVLRDLVASILRSQGAFGNMQSEHAMEGLLDQLTKGYRKRKVAERKSIRAVINWCSGLAEMKPEAEGALLRTVLSQGNPEG